MKTPPLLVKHDSPAGPYWYHPDHPDCQDGQVLWEEPTPPHTPESLLALTKSPEGLEQMRIIAAKLDGWYHVQSKDLKFPSVYPEGAWRHPDRGTWLFQMDCKVDGGIPRYPTSLDAIFAAEDRLRIHDVHSQLNSEWKKHLTRVSEITGIGFLSFTPPLRLIPFILTAQWKEQNP